MNLIAKFENSKRKTRYSGPKFKKWIGLNETAGISDSRLRIWISNHNQRPWNNSNSDNQFCIFVCHSGSEILNLWILSSGSYSATSKVSEGTKDTMRNNKNTPHELCIIIISFMAHFILSIVLVSSVATYKCGVHALANFVLNVDEKLYSKIGLITIAW